MIRMNLSWFTFLWFALCCSIGFAAPTITSIAPAQGPPGTQVIIVGSGFSDIASVKFNSAPADFSVLSPTRIIAVVPPLSASGPIGVEAPSGIAQTTGVFLVSPRITELLPTRSATNSLVTIFGENFESVTSVRFGTIESAYQIISTSQIIVRVPAGAANNPIEVISFAGAGTSPTEFVVTGPGPLIDSFSPEIAPPGETVVINGVNFTSVTNVRFNGVAALNFAVTAPTQIRAVVPANASTGPIRITAKAGEIASVSNLTVTRAPVITNFFPAFGTAGTEVTISGINIEGATGVSFNSVRATAFGTPAQGQASAIVPPTATTGPIRVSNSFGIGISTTPFVITQAPIITELSTTVVAPGETLTITGANFLGSTIVKFTGHDASPIVVAATLLHVTVPVGAKTGPVTVVSPQGSGTSEETVQIIGSAPFINELIPDHAPRGTEITISGLNFSDVRGIRFNGIPAAFFAAGSTQVRAIVPATATSGPVTVTTGAGTSTNAALFFAPPRLASFTPTSAVAGDEIVILGTNFFGAFAVTVGGVDVGPFHIVTNKITAMLPLRARTGPVIVTTPAGAIISTNTFTILPRILNFAPQAGPAGTRVSIIGTSFFDVQEVTFGGRIASFTVVSPEEIVATVPSGAAPGSIHIKTTDGIALSNEAFIATFATDLAIVITQRATFTLPGDIESYSIVVTNRGPSATTGTIVSDTLPNNALFVSAMSPRGPCIFTNGIVTCALGLLTSGESLQITIEARFNVEGVFANRVKVQAVETESFPGDNTALSTTVVVRDASRTLSLETLPSGKKLVLSWPTSPVPFILQASTNASGAPIWLEAIPKPVLQGGRNRVTNELDGLTKFYRLRQGP